MAIRWGSVKSVSISDFNDYLLQTLYFIDLQFSGLKNFLIKPIDFKIYFFFLFFLFFFFLFFCFFFFVFLFFFFFFVCRKWLYWLLIKGQKFWWSAIFGTPIQTLLDVKSIWLAVTIFNQIVSWHFDWSLSHQANNRFRGREVTGSSICILTDRSLVKM